jgi:hypothetical protein
MDLFATVELGKPRVAVLSHEMQRYTNKRALLFSHGFF